MRGCDDLESSRSQSIQMRAENISDDENCMYSFGSRELHFIYFHLTQTQLQSLTKMNK